MLNLAIEIMVAALLVLSIGYNLKIQRKLNQLQAGRTDLDAFLQNFSQAISRAEQNIHQLKEVSQMAGTHLRDQIDKAKHLANDLSFLTDRGEVLATTLEQHISSSRDAVAKQKLAQHPHFKTPLPQTSPLQAPQPPSRIQPRSQDADMVVPEITASKRRVLEDVMQQIASRRARSQKPAQPSASTPTSVPTSAAITERQQSNFSLGKMLDARRLKESLQSRLTTES